MTTDLAFSCFAIELAALATTYRHGFCRRLYWQSVFTVWPSSLQAPAALGSAHSQHDLMRTSKSSPLSNRALSELVEPRE